MINDELRQKIYQAVFSFESVGELHSCFPSLSQVYYSINKNINHRRGDRESRALSIDLSNLCVSSNRRSLQSFVKMRQQEPRNPVGVRSRNSNSFTIDSQGNNIPINTVSNSSSPDSDNVDRKPYPMTPSGELFFFFMISGFRNFFSSPSYHKFERYIYLQWRGGEKQNCESFDVSEQALNPIKEPEKLCFLYRYINVLPKSLLSTRLRKFNMTFDKLVYSRNITSTKKSFSQGNSASRREFTMSLVGLRYMIFCFVWSSVTFYERTFSAFLFVVRNLIRWQQKIDLRRDDVRLIE